MPLAPLPPERRRPPHLGGFTAALFAAPLAVAACGDDGGGGSGGTDGSGGTTSGATGGSDTGTAGGTASGTTGGAGGLGGLVTFTYYTADAETPDPALGFAGGYREGGMGSLWDFYAVQAFQRTFPAPPSDEDTVVDEEIPVPFDWGKTSDWVTAGGGIKLASGEALALACLLPAEDYPVYVAEDSVNLAAACKPDPAAFVPAAPYDLTLYGGDAFEDVLLSGVVRTPPALTVTAPDLSVYNLQVSASEDLEVTWTGEGEAESWVTLRLWDQFGYVLTAHPADDGAFTVPATELQKLTAGPAWITVARERAHDLSFAAGQVTVVTRYETWGYLDLI